MSSSMIAKKVAFEYSPTAPNIARDVTGATRRSCSRTNSRKALLTGMSEVAAHRRSRDSGIELELQRQPAVQTVRQFIGRQPAKPVTLVERRIPRHVVERRQREVPRARGARMIANVYDQTRAEAAPRVLGLN